MGIADGEEGVSRGRNKVGGGILRGGGLCLVETVSTKIGCFLPLLRSLHLGKIIK